MQGATSALGANIGLESVYLLSTCIHLAKGMMVLKGMVERWERGNVLGSLGP